MKLLFVLLVATGGIISERVLQAEDVPECGGKPYYEQPIKYFYDEDTDLCYGYRNLCDGSDIEGEYADIQSCIDENLRLGSKKSVTMVCGKGSGVVKDPKTGRALITDRCYEPDRFCEVGEHCYNATTYAFCCKDHLPDRIVHQEYVPEPMEDEESPCLENEIRFYYDEDVQQCLGYRDGCEQRDEGYDTIEACVRNSNMAKVLAHRILHKSYWCFNGYTPSAVSTSTGALFPLIAKTNCADKQFCASNQICMQRDKLGYCCDKGTPSLRKFVLKKLP